MAPTKVTETYTASISEKAGAIGLDAVDQTLGKQITADGDYSGAVGKSDPREIVLVKKLDFRIMPCLWAMYFL